MRLYFDIGNSNIKLNFNIKGKEYYVAFNTKENYSVDSFYNALPIEIREEKISSVMICSVVPEKLRTLEGVSKKYWQISPVVLKFPIKTGLKLKVIDPKTVGADIISLGAFVSSKVDNGIIVNMGTATTISHIKDKTLQGVIIAPGLKTSVDGLLKNSAKLNDLELYVPKNKNLGNTTDEALSIGAIKGHVHMIKGLVGDIDKDATVFLSGGNSRSIKDFLFEYEYIKEATIEGLKIIEVLNENK
ncbi:MAG: type III pantothenate kinase [Mycoplasmataceae bacterium]|nr:type III pantothenate kinase [Mycoplasmataceae bacterium]